jgi:hypothetical protein
MAILAISHAVYLTAIQCRGKRYMHPSTIGTDHVVELFSFHDLLLVMHMMETCALKYSLIEYALN